jgi:hypothetical protein
MTLVRSWSFAVNQRELRVARNVLTIAGCIVLVLALSSCRTVYPNLYLDEDPGPPYIPPPRSSCPDDMPGDKTACGDKDMDCNYALTCRAGYVCWLAHSDLSWGSSYPAVCRSGHWSSTTELSSADRVHSIEVKKERIDRLRRANLALQRR